VYQEVSNVFGGFHGLGVIFHSNQDTISRPLGTSTVDLIRMFHPAIAVLPLKAFNKNKTGQTKKMLTCPVLCPEQDIFRTNFLMI
jgi:hypothetical protein